MQNRIDRVMTRGKLNDVGEGEREREVVGLWFDVRYEY